jgi:hypothetical protein
MLLWEEVSLKTRRTPTGGVFPRVQTKRMAVCDTLRQSTKTSRTSKFLERRNEKILHGMSDAGRMETPDYGPTGGRNI